MTNGAGEAGATSIAGGADDYVGSTYSPSAKGRPGERGIETRALLRAKKGLRAHMRATRDAIPADERASLSKAACERFAEEVGGWLATKASRPLATVALFFPMGSELSTLPLLELLPQRYPDLQFSFCVPVVLNRSRLMEFVQVTPEELHAAAEFVDVGRRSPTHEPDASSRLGATNKSDAPTKKDAPDFLAHPARIAAIPPDRAVVATNRIDVILVPGLAFDRRGMRLGYGGSYYDAYLARPEMHAVTCGVCFDEQMMSCDLPVGAQDQRLDALVTPSQTACFPT